MPKHGCFINWVNHVVTRSSCLTWLNIVSNGWTDWFTCYKSLLTKANRVDLLYFCNRRWPWLDWSRFVVILVSQVKTCLTCSNNMVNRGWSLCLAMCNHVTTRLTCLTWLHMVSNGWTYLFTCFKSLLTKAKRVDLLYLYKRGWPWLN